MQKKKFEVKTHIDPYSGLLKKDVFIDDKLFEWEVDEKSWKAVKEMGPTYVEQAKGDIMKHFCDSLSDFLGRKVSPQHILMATQKGWI